MNADDQLNELDDILNEFGLSGEKVGENEDDYDDDEEEEEADPCDTKNDKHRLETRNGERKRLERIKGRDWNERDGGRYCCAPTKSQKKGKSPAEIAAATAAKEMKAKKEQAAKDAKKKKKKDKYAHGGPR